MPSQRSEIEAIYRSHGAIVFQRCRYLLRSDEAARDATQEVFLKAVRAWDTFRRESSASTWLIRIATHHCLNQLESQRAGWRSRFTSYAAHSAEVRERAQDTPDLQRDLRVLLAKFDRETQEIAISYFVDEMTQAEIAESTGRSLPTVRKRLEKFVRVARKELGRELA